MSRSFARSTRPALAIPLLVIFLLASSIGPASSAPSAEHTYTFNVDLDKGVKNNIVNNSADELQLDDTVTAFPFIWVALSARGTIARIDTRTGAIQGEYSTTHDLDGAHNPSRTTVTNDGSVWAGNRGQSSVVHVGLAEAGQCIDRNKNGSIETSTGYGNVLGWANYGGAGDADNADSAQDECILHYIDTFGGDARHVSVDRNGDVWVGANDTKQFQRLDGKTGVVEVPATVLPCGGYGGLSDGNGILWSAQSGAKLLRWNPEAATVLSGLDEPTSNPRCISLPIYGLAFDSQNNVWATTFNNTQKIYKVSPDGATRQEFDQGNPQAQGVAVDKNDDVWVSSALNQGANAIAHLKNDGTLVGRVTTADQGVNIGSGSTGVSVDAAGKVWTANYASSSATRIDAKRGPSGTGGTPIGIFDLHVDLPGSQPYNYSDMTGATLTGKPGSGTWTDVFDSGIKGAEWGALTWHAMVPPTGDLAFTVASSPDGVTFGPAKTANREEDLTVADGRYLRITATFTRASDGESPVLSHLNVRTTEEPVTALLTADGGVVRAEFTGPVSGVTVDSFALAHDPTNDAVPTAISCYSAADEWRDCEGADVEVAYLYPTNGLRPGSRYVGYVNRSPDGITDALGRVVAAAEISFAAPVQVEEWAGSAAWRRRLATAAIGDDYHSGRLVGSTAHFSFTGSSATLYTMNGPRNGKADVLIDGRLMPTIDTYYPSTRRVSRTYRNLGAGEHTLEVIVLGTRRAASRANTVAVDALKAGAHYLSPEGFRFSRVGDGAWGKQINVPASQSSFVQADVAGERFEFRFTGTGFNWGTVTGRNMGKAEVYVDGTRVATFDNYSYGTRYKVERRMTGLTDGAHRAIIKVLGKRRTASKANMIAFDYFEATSTPEGDGLK
ncbi:MAG TPA: hypothetical protein VM600_05080 [Actinomycetota bacterium]|nr:hypothetical protein [Actinomycetota bacterium]